MRKLPKPVRNTSAVTDSFALSRRFPKAKGPDLSLGVSPAHLPHGLTAQLIRALLSKDQAATNAVAEGDSMLRLERELAASVRLDSVLELHSACGDLVVIEGEERAVLALGLGSCFGAHVPKNVLLEEYLVDTAGSGFMAVDAAVLAEETEVRTNADSFELAKVLFGEGELGRAKPTATFAAALAFKSQKGHGAYLTRRARFWTALRSTSPQELAGRLEFID